MESEYYDTLSGASAIALLVVLTCNLPEWHRLSDFLTAGSDNHAYILCAESLCPCWRSPGMRGKGKEWGSPFPVTKTFSRHRESQSYSANVKSHGRASSSSKSWSRYAIPRLRI